MGIRSKITLLIAAAAFLLFALLGGSIVENVPAGEFRIKQAFITGELTAHMEPGWFGQWCGSVHSYRYVSTIGFGESEGEGSADVGAVKVIFNDGSKADISALLRIQLPNNQDKALMLKKLYAGGYDHFIKAGIVPIAENAIKLAANLRSAQDAYTTLALFQQDVEDQLRNGIYVTKSNVIERTTSAGDTEKLKVTEVVYDKYDENGNPIGEPKRLSNVLADLGCEVSQCIISVPKFDPQVEKMISARKDEAMKTELAKQAAIRAQQDRITAEEQGKANVKKAQYEKEEEKIRAVVDAQKEAEVAAWEAKQALETAKKIKAEGEAEAYAARAKVAAGLTPQEKAEWNYKTTVGVAEKMAGINFPTMMIFGGGKGGPTNPFDAVGLDAFMKINEKLQK